MKSIFPYSSEQGVCYTGFRIGGDSWSDGRSLPKTGSVNVNMLTPHLPGAFHVEPYSESIHAVLEDIIVREETLSLQLTQLKTSAGHGLGSDGAYNQSAIYLAVCVIAQTGLTDPSAVPAHVQAQLGALRCSAVGPHRNQVSRMVSCCLAPAKALFVRVADRHTHTNTNTHTHNLS